MTAASRKPPPRPIRDRPAGQELVLAAGAGVAVTVTLDSHAEVPTFAFVAGAAPLVEKQEYLPVPRRK